jgi:IS5 family transposase
MSDQRGFFDLGERYRALSKAGDPLERLGRLVDFEMFRAELVAALARSDGARGGRPPLDPVMMFKVLVLQALYNLSDAQAEYQVMDRRSFGRFLGLDDGDTVPDETTVWRFREALIKAGAIARLFARFDAHLKQAGYLAMGGQIIDASIVAAPRQRMTEEEKGIVKGGGVPKDWKARPRKLAQKDRDARWTLKRGGRKKDPDGKVQLQIAVPAFGYKTHINMDRRHGFIRKWRVSDAARHDGRELKALLDKANTASTVWADTAYRSRKNERAIAKAGLFSKVHFRKPRDKAMPEPLARANAARSKKRSMIEHVFARQKGPMNLFVRTIGIARARIKIGMANLAYNFTRYVFWHGRLTQT